jgi:hypothetical protein
MGNVRVALIRGIFFFEEISRSTAISYKAKKQADSYNNCYYINMITQTQEERLTQRTRNHGAAEPPPQPCFAAWFLLWLRPSLARGSSNLIKNPSVPSLPKIPSRIDENSSNAFLELLRCSQQISIPPIHQPGAYLRDRNSLKSRPAEQHPNLLCKNTVGMFGWGC